MPCPSGPNPVTTSAINVPPPSGSSRAAWPKNFADIVVALAGLELEQTPAALLLFGVLVRLEQRRSLLELVFRQLEVGPLGGASSISASFRAMRCAATATANLDFANNQASVTDGENRRSVITIDLEALVARVILEHEHGGAGGEHAMLGRW